MNQFFVWCEQRGLALTMVSPFAVATYIEQLTRDRSAPTVKQHLSAIRRLFDWLVVGQVLPISPAASMRGPKHVVKTGKTPVLTAAEARQLLDSIDGRTIIGLRDRALIGVMVYSFARVSAAIFPRAAIFNRRQQSAWTRSNASSSETMTDKQNHHPTTEKNQAPRGAV